MLYWKLYSTAGSKGTNILNWFADAAKRESAEASLTRVTLVLPASVGRDPKLIVELIRELPPVPGMGAANDCRLPVRTTFLHFHYPDVVPVFDKMVLAAVGVEEDGANQSYSVLREYLPFAWEMADRYADASSECNREAPLRRVDMALWVSRGSS